MIVRENGNYFILIEQTNHAELSGELAASWKEEGFPGNSFRQSVEYAAARHDDGWGPFDQSPFLNDKTQRPYSFDAFPEIPKTVVYKQGVDETAAKDAYAGLLCSVHCVNFYKDPEAKELRTFIEQERDRQARLRAAIDGYDEDHFQAHYDLLQFVDALSLFVCLNEPGTPAEKGHPFFQNGIPLPTFLDAGQKMLIPEWLDSETIVLDVFPFDQEVEGTLKLKKVPKAAITEKGLLESYQAAFEEDKAIRFVSR